MMFFQLIYLLVCTVDVKLEVTETAIKGEIDPCFEYLGETTDGKKYYADITFRKNWEDAKTHCENNGMRLARIDSLEQAAFLNFRTSQPGTFVGVYWTAGRDALELRQFSWDGTNTQPLSRPADGAALDAGAVKRSCLVYKASPTVHRYNSRLCTDIASALCEM